MGFPSVCFLFVLASACWINKGDAHKKTKTTDVCPGDNWAQLDSTCYYYLSTTKTWNAGEKDCETRGGTLLIFKSQDEVAKVFKKIKEIAKNIDSVPHFWMGVHNQDEDRVFRYADGSDVTKSNWKKMLNEASGSGHCVALRSSDSKGNSKSWDLRDCTESLPFVCEIQLSVARWSGWSQWTDCSVSCGDGSRTRTRTCLRASDASGECVGEAVKTEVCSNKCQLPAVWGEWSGWGTCSKTCGAGQKRRTRSCLNSGDGGECVGASEDNVECSVEDCPVWSEWTECSVTCGRGERSRTISCSDGKSCKHGISRQTEECRETTCPVWTRWEEWGPCSQTCDTGTRSRSRSCSVVNGCKGESTETNNCENSDCIIWSEWTECSVTCGRGERSRTSSCERKKCKHGTSRQTEECGETTCPVWAQWEDWSPCSKTCDTGTRSRSRSCSVINGCRGESTETNSCKSKDCLIWSEWTECSVTCGRGERSRTSSCEGKKCKHGTSRQTEECGENTCPVWTRWEDWSPCSQTCDTGTRSRSRSCSVVNGCRGESTETNNCISTDCIIWGEWTECSVTCGRGERSRTSSCEGKKCKDGTSRQTEECGETTCPVWTRWEDWSPFDLLDSIKLSEWGPWGDCSVTCGKGKITRSRSCRGLECKQETTQTKTCNMKNCKGKSHWTKWDLWSACSVTCGVGMRTRQRQCVNADGDVINTCRGSETQSRRCLAPCRDVAAVEKLMRECPPDHVAGLKKIMDKVSNTKIKEDIFTGQDLEDWVIVGYEIEEVIVDRPLTCARLCLRSGSCKSFNYEYLLTDGKNDLSVPKHCVLNSVNKDYDRKALKTKEGYKLFDLEPFFV
ncbi:A disintegrin and metalloproteinase with thrombospondin motifs adt-1-like [Haliotis cracherodii]|uniref:A disintegrin and metalloproteinase with thrombospondin motifs adt-1-like n=1 Tax=Haliotis cracherodii TaxID=6455 RepID=UPI0039ECC167